MQIHGDNMVYPRNGEQVGEHTGGNGTAVALLLGLSRIRKVSRLGQHALMSQTRWVAYGMTAAEQIVSDRLDYGVKRAYQ